MDLYPHQAYAVDWLVPRRRAALFDDMGLGKTGTAICAAEKLGAQRVLVVCPTVVTRNWEREVRNWAPQARAQVITSGRAQVNAQVEYVIVSHSLLRRPPLLAQLVRAYWDVIILDEAHAMKNPTAKRTRAFYQSIVRNNGGRHVWLLTGTPMPNNPSELWTMLAGLAPERIHDAAGKPMHWRAFRDRYCELAPSAFTPDGVRVVGAKNLDELRDRMRGFSLRRTKKQVLNLPPMRWGTVSLTVDKLPKELLAIEHDLSTDPQVALQQLSEDKQFSTWRRLCAMAKVEAAGDLLVEELASGAYAKVVVFAHHVDVLDALELRFKEFGCVRISGDVQPHIRTQRVDLFQNDPKTRVCIANLVAGGVGITLTAASEVAFVEQSFVPGDNRQAADRCHRIGQTAPVMARVLTLAGSIDEIIGEILARKAEMIRGAIGE